MSHRASRVAARAALLACAALVAAGCGGGDESEGTPALTAGSPLGEGGTLIWAVAGRVRSVDPLTASSRAEQIVSRQVHEPLVDVLTGPFGDTREVPGLARRVRPSSDATIWTLRLRRGVRFQDGTPFNADAVLANIERWRTTEAGAALIPGIANAFAPRFDVVKVILAAPDEGFAERLEQPRLGIVSPRALQPRSGTGARMRSVSGTGTGPFELREQTAGSRLLARNTAWWGSAGGANLGPALEQAEIRTEPTAAVRLALLDSGEVQVADELGASQARLARSDALLDALPGADGTWLGLERSVRGIDSGREIPSLARVWLTTVRVAD